MKFVPVDEREDTEKPGQIDRAFFDKVYEQVRAVPYGRVCTYGDIAELAGYPGMARQVGAAMAGIEPGSDLPAHRIVNAKGTLAPGYAFGGKQVQRRMLEEEGVTFIEKGAASEPTIDMASCRWPDARRDAGAPTSSQLSFDFWENL